MLSSRGVHPLLGRRLPALAGLAAATALVVGTLTAPAQADNPQPALPDDVSSGIAQAALAQVQPLIDPDAPATEPTSPLARRLLGLDTGADSSTGAKPDLTMALRDLRIHQDELSRADRATAAQALARPSLPNSDCSFTSVCVHYALTGSNATTVAFARTVGTVADQVLATYKKAGYRAPESDGTRGGNAKLDLYLRDLGAGYYGYCQADTLPDKRGPYDTAAFCGFNTDFSWAPKHTATENLKVTAAHELFHAVQFAYDYYEDQWFMEATATWAEDEVYTGINDNRQYLRASPLAQPRQSLDQFNNYTLRQYGEWIFFRYLSERFAKQQGGLPVIIRKIWQRADAAKGGPDNYSIQAIKKELASRGKKLPTVFAQFADANRRPAKAYREGKAYRTAKPGKSVRLTSARRDTRWQKVRLNHLAATTIQVKPGAGTTGKRWRARVTLDLPNTSRGSAAVVSVYHRGGKVSSKVVRLGRTGAGRTTVPFNRSSVNRVEVTLANAGTHYQCWTGPRGDVTYSCSGRPLDNKLPFSYRVQAIR